MFPVTVPVIVQLEVAAIVPTLMETVAPETVEPNPAQDPAVVKVPDTVN